MLRRMFASAVAAVALLATAGTLPAQAAPAPAVPIVSPVEITANMDVNTAPKPTKKDKAYKATTRDKAALKGMPSEFRTFACPCFNWVGARQQMPVGTTFNSAAANLHIENAYLRTVPPEPAGTSTYHTLGQLHVKSAGDEAIEFGWTRDPSLFGDAQPRIFAGYRKNGVWQGYGTGFTDYAPNVNHTYGSVVPTGTPKRFQIVYTGGNWWLAYDLAWIGYFSGALFPAPDTFTSANLFQGFYEVADRNVQSCADMGNGELASSGTSARVGSVNITGTVPATATNVLAFDEPAGSIGYTVSQITAETVRGGGPGANSALNAVGITGSC